MRNILPTQMAKMDVLDKLEVRGSGITTPSVLPFIPNLSKLLLSDNYYMTNILQNAFAQLPSLSVSLFLPLSCDLVCLRSHNLYLLGHLLHL